MEILEDFGALSTPDLPFTHQVVVHVPQHLRDRMNIDMEENLLVLSCTNPSEYLSWKLPYPALETTPVTAKYKKKTSTLTIRLALSLLPSQPPPSSCPPHPSPSIPPSTSARTSSNSGCMKMAQELLSEGTFEDLIEALQVRGSIKGADGKAPQIVF